MLPRVERLTTAAFAAAFGHSRVLRHPLLQLRVHWRRTGTPGARAAFVVPKKLGKATWRNRTRRRVRERYRLHPLRSDRRLSGCDFLFMATSETAQSMAGELDAAITQLLERAINMAGAGRKVGASRQLAPAAVLTRDALTRDVREQDEGSRM